MELIFLIVASGTLLYFLFTIVEFTIGLNQIKNLSHQAVAPHDNLPSISIIFSALNEETHIEAALLSHLKLNYPQFEIIAVNDRSTDKTPAILDRLQKRFDRLRVYHIEKLPEGWLGKNHALFVASEHATGDWLLFTDADVFMKPDALLKSISYALENKLDHLTICEHHLRNSIGLKILLLSKYIGYCMGLKPWLIRNQSSKRSLGHGAFNLVKKSVYQQCGTHRHIAMECLDDLKLGEMIKQNGFHQDTVDGRDFIEREWYSSLQNMISGWKKNSFAFFDYRLSLLARDSLFVFILFFLPLISLFIFSGWIRWINIVSICLTIYLFTFVAAKFRLEKRYALLYPVAMFLMLYTIWNSAFATLKNGGVVWRGTHYPLKELRSKKVPI